MLSPTDYQTIVCLMESGIIAGYETYNQLVLAMDNVSSANSISEGRKIAFSGDLLNATESLYLLDDTFVEEKNFIGQLHQYIIDNYGSLSDFLISNGITVPQGVADLSALAGYAIPTSQIGICSNANVLSSSSSSSFVVNVIKLSNTDYAWTFSKNFSNTSFSLEDVAGLVLGSSNLPTSVLSVSSPAIALRYAVNSSTTWQIIPPVNIIFTDGVALSTDSGLIE